MAFRNRIAECTLTRSWKTANDKQDTFHATIVVSLNTTVKMEIKKAGNSYNKYAMELSYGELEAINSALASKHEGPVADELYNGLNWYFQRLPKPGSEETKLKELDNPDAETSDEGDIGLDAPDQMDGEGPLPDVGLSDFSIEDLSGEPEPGDVDDGGPIADFDLDLELPVAPDED